MTDNGAASDRPFVVAIVGAGPGGFYAAESLLRAADDIAVYMFEQLPVPFGLVRYGVAPDHPKLKSVTAVFDRIARMDGFHFVGNVEVGRDVSVADLQTHFNAIIFAYGAERGNRLGIPGEDLSGSHNAHSFVAWYNGHPNYRDLPVDLDTETAVVIGQGNVALDIARILAKPINLLSKTDMADHALEVLAQSRIRTIHVIGRRGPAQVQFVSKELREFVDAVGFRSEVDADELALGETCKRELEDPDLADAGASLELLRSFVVDSAGSQTAPRSCRFRFRLSPVAIEGTYRVQSLTLKRTKLTGPVFQQRAGLTDDIEVLPCGLIISSVGYRARPIDSLPLDGRADRLENTGGRITRRGNVIPGLYAAGWVKRGPKGTIGTNRGDSVETVAALLSDRPALNGTKRSPEKLINTLEDRNLYPLSYAHWQAIDALEVQLAESSDRPRVKLTEIDEMLAACR